MRPHARVLTPILEVLYEAPLTPSNWAKFLDGIARAVGAEAAALLLRDSADKQAMVARFWSRMPDKLPEPGMDRDRLHRWIHAANHAADTVSTARRIVTLEEFKNHEFFDDLTLSHQMPNGIFAIAERSTSRLASILLCRTRDEEPFCKRELDFVRSLCPHIAQAYRLQSHLAGSRHQRDSLRSALDSLAMGVILLAARGRVITLNRAAEQLLAESDVLQATSEGLRALHPGDAAKVEHLVAEAIAASEEQRLGTPGLMMLSNHRGSSLLMLISPVRGPAFEGISPVRAIVFLTDPAQRVRPTQATLRYLFGLTPAEYRLAMLLADGQTPPVIADMIGVSRNTLKSQLSGIYRKTGTSRQAELVGLLLQLPTANTNEVHRAAG